jgi:hypothetical protein
MASDNVEPKHCDASAVRLDLRCRLFETVIVLAPEGADHSHAAPGEVPCYGQARVPHP